MANLPRLPEPRPGETIKASHIKQLADAIRRCWIIPVIGGGIDAAYSDNGVALSASGSARGAALFRVTTEITGASGAAYGGGRGIIQKDDGSALSDNGTDTQLIKTNNEKGIKVGSFIICVFALGSWWVAVPDECGHLI